MPETNTAVDNGDPIEVTFESTLAEIAALGDQLDLADEALEELQGEAKDVQTVVRSAPLRLLVRRLNEVRAILDSMGDGLTEAASSVEALAEVHDEEVEEEGDESEEQ